MCSLHFRSVLRCYKAKLPPFYMDAKIIISGPFLKDSQSLMPTLAPAPECTDGGDSREHIPKGGKIKAKAQGTHRY